MTSPRFTHDCTGCIFVDQIEDFDLYFCPNCDEGTLIYRFGDEGGQYSSFSINVMLQSVIKHPEQCERAFLGILLVVDKGLFTFTAKDILKMELWHLEKSASRNIYLDDKSIEYKRYWELKKLLKGEL